MLTRSGNYKLPLCCFNWCKWSA